MEEQSDFTFQQEMGMNDKDLVEAVRQKQWDTVRELIEGDVDHTTRRWAVQKAISDASDEQLLRILPHCTDDQVEKALTEAVSRCMWEAVAELVARGSDNATRTRTVQECVLPHCSQDQLDSVLMKAVGKELWDCAETILNVRREMCKDARPAELCGKSDADDKLLDLIKSTVAGKDLTGSDVNIQNRDHLLLEALTWHLWEGVVTLLQFVDDEQQKWVWLEASRFAPTEVLENTIMKANASCLSQVSDRALRNLVNRDMWNIVKIFSGRGHVLALGMFIILYCRELSVPDTLKIFVLQEASKRATGDDLEAILDSLCDENMVDSVLPNLLERQQWKALGIILLVLSPTQAELVLKQAEDKADKETLERLFEGCSHKQLNDGVIRLAVKHGFWRVASRYLSFSSFHFFGFHMLTAHRDYISEETRRWVVDEALRRAGDSEFGSIAPHCLDDQLKRVLTETVSRRLWGVTKRLMERETDTEKLNWVVAEASKYADEDVVLGMILNTRYYTGADCVFPQAVERGMWSVVAELLKQEPRPPEAQCKWAIREASRRAEGYQLERLCPFCPDDQLDELIQEVIKRQAWNCVAYLFSRGLTDDLQKLALGKAINHLSEFQIRRIIPYCVDSQLDTVLKESVTRRVWDNVLEVLKHKTNCSLQYWAVTEASKHAPEYKFHNLIPYCGCDQLDSVLVEMVRREMWTCVCELFKREISSRQRQWALEKASQTAPEHCIVSLLQYVTDDQLCSVLKEAVRRHMWKCVCAILERKVDPVQKEFAIREASIQASGFKLLRLLPFVTEDCLHFVLTTVVERRMWDCVCDLLKREVQDTDRMMALEEASRHAADTELLPLLPYVSDDNLHSLLITFVQRRLWKCVSGVLKREIQDKDRKLALEEASREAPEFLLPEILEHCPDDAVESVFVELLRRRLWPAINCLLHRKLDSQQKLSLRKVVDQTKLDLNAEVIWTMGQDAWAAVSLLLECSAVTDETRRKAVEEIFNCSHYECTDRDFINMIQHCSHAQLLSALQETVYRNLPRTACDILRRIGQDGDPLAVTDDNQTILLISMEIQTGRRQLVAECLKLGIGTHHPQDLPMNTFVSYSRTLLEPNRSTFRRAALDNDPVLMRMLLEAGVCSNSEVHELSGEVSTWCLQSELFETSFQDMSKFLRNASSTPRSLKSACRLVISHHLGVGCGRQERVKQLPLPEQMKEYISFSDLETVEMDDAMNDDVTRSDAEAAAVRDVETRLMASATSDDSDNEYVDDEHYSDDDFDYGFHNYFGYDSDLFSRFFL